jgi:hypothetical protein
MHRKVKVLMARRLASRIEMRNRRLRRPPQSQRRPPPITSIGIAVWI